MQKVASKCGKKSQKPHPLRAAKDGPPNVNGLSQKRCYEFNGGPPAKFTRLKEPTPSSNQPTTSRWPSLSFQLLPETLISQRSRRRHPISLAQLAQSILFAFQREHRCLEFLAMSLGRVGRKILDSLIGLQEEGTAFVNIEAGYYVQCEWGWNVAAKPIDLR